MVNEIGFNNKKFSLVVDKLIKLLGKEKVLSEKRDLMVYGYDSTPFKGKPMVVVLPEKTEEVQGIIKTAAEFGLPVVPRGAGTSLSGGPIASMGGIVVSLTPMDKILSIDLDNNRATIQPGVTNQRLQKELEVFGYWFPPDPASLSVATIGGNVAENAGGPHCLKYGVTSNHVVDLRIVKANGEVINTGTYLETGVGYDLTGILVGSEGTLGIVTEITVRISKKPEATSTILALFESSWDAASSVSEIIRNGLNPSVLEMIEERMLTEVNTVFNLGYPETIKSLLIIEVDGKREGLPFELEKIEAICRNNNVKVLESAQTEDERERLWLARRGGTSALGRLKPDSAENDIVVPRSKLPHMVEKIKEISKRNEVIMGAVIHAGDGNCHPQVPFDASLHNEAEAAEQALWEVFEAAVQLGGTISGEHGVGLEKIRGMGLVFTQDEMLLMRRFKLLMDPQEILNPDKIFPPHIISLAKEGGSDDSGATR
ncbi:MAG: FAD-binding oxidoreductase [Bacillota bacterium]